MVLPFCVNFVALLSRFSRIWFRRKKVLAGGGNLVQVFLHLVRLIDVGGSQSGKADDRIHPKKQICSGMKMGNKSYFTYKRAEQEEILKKIEENYKLLWNMWKKYGRMGEKRKVVSKCYLTFSESSMVTKKTKNKRRRKMKFLPKPKEVKLLTGEHALCYDGRIVLDGRLLGNGDTYAKVLQKGIKKETGMQYDIGYGVPGRKETGAIVLELDETRKSQQYVLQVTEEEIRIQGGDGAGVLYGVQTLCQMMHEYGALLPAVRIEDEPDLPVRGYYLDETRGRVLTLSYLKQVADRMAYYKLNQLQLYVEHTYLFSGLSEMWRDETPLTAEEIRELDAYCAKLHIELVPSIATFGHLYMLLSTKSYGDLCEFPDSWKEPFSFWDRMQHHTVDVSGGRAIELIKAMIEEYMALFATDKFNICADETFDLGKGKSKPLADEKGVHRLYIDYVKELCEFLVAKGKKPMFWGDIICAQPELIKELPEETVCLTWGYAAEQREHEAKVMAEAGARQYLCPGVGGWNQWMNLVENSYKNIARMCGYARKYHAEGVLNTDWGDCGHINQPDFSLPGMIYGAVFSWGDDTDSFEELNEQISRLAYGDRSGKFVSYMAKTAECSIFDWWDANVVYEEKVLGHPNNRNALFDARIQDEAKRAAAKETIAALKKELKKTAGALEESCRPMVPVLELTMEAIDIWNETGARMCDIELGKEKDETACAALAGRLETWFMKYKASWRSISKEGDLHHISEIVFWYADILRGRKPYEK